MYVKQVKPLGVRIPKIVNQNNHKWIRHKDPTKVSCDKCGVSKDSDGAGVTCDNGALRREWLKKWNS